MIIFNFFIEFYCICALEQQLEIEQVDSHYSGARAMPFTFTSFSEILVGMCSVESFKSLAVLSPVVSWFSQCSPASAFRGCLGLSLKLLLGVLLAVHLESRDLICFALPVFLQREENEEGGRGAGSLDCSLPAVFLFRFLAPQCHSSTVLKAISIIGLGR